MKILLILCLMVSGSSFAALRGVYAGIRGGSVAPSSGTDGGTGLGVDVGLRVNKSYDWTMTMQSSNGHPSGFTSSMLGTGIDMRMFRGMAEMELSLGIGIGAYSLNIYNQSSLQPGINGGLTLDFVFSRSFHLGMALKLHGYPNNPNYGNGFQTLMARFGYFFGFTDNSLTLPDMN